MLLPTMLLLDWLLEIAVDHVGHTLEYRRIQCRKSSRSAARARFIRSVV
jgi:hypothetical protein